MNSRAFQKCCCQIHSFSRQLSAWTKDNIRFFECFGPLELLVHLGCYQNTFDTVTLTACEGMVRQNKASILMYESFAHSSTANFRILRNEDSKTAIFPNTRQRFLAFPNSEKGTSTKMSFPCRTRSKLENSELKIVTARP